MRLKLALLATGAVSAVAAGGFAYATVGNSSPTTSAKLPDPGSAVQHGPTVQRGPAAPRSLPSCLPDVRKHLPNAPDTRQLPQVPGTDQLPNVPGADQLRQAPGTDQLPQAPGAGQLPKAPGDLPTCAPKLPSDPTANLPKVPAQPDLPSVPNVASCSSVPPAIHMVGGRARDFTLPNGMHLAFSHTHAVMIDGRRACGIVQKFVGDAQQSFTVERLDTPPQASVEDVAKALKLPDTGKIVSLGGLNTWQSPLNNGSMWVSDKGYALSVSGSPAMASELPAIVSQLRQTA